MANNQPFSERYLKAESTNADVSKPSKINNESLIPDSNRYASTKPRRKIIRAKIIRGEG